MNPTIVIPSYWAGDSADLESPGAYDHASEVGSARPELDRCLASLEQVRNIGRIIVLLVCPQHFPWCIWTYSLATFSPIPLPVLPLWELA